MLILALLSQAADQPPAAPVDRPSITVIGTAIVDTPPDEAEFDMVIIGEGRDSDAATKALAAKQATILSAIAALGHPVAIQTEVIQLNEALAGECPAAYSFNKQRLATGACAVVGYVARVGVSIRLSAPKDVGTAMGLAGRLGAQSVKLEGFRLRDDAAARLRATELAFADARSRGSAIAASAGSRLGGVVTLLDGTDPDRARRGALTSMREEEVISHFAEPPPVPVPVSPPPVRTFASVTVTFALIR